MFSEMTRRKQHSVLRAGYSCTALLYRLKMCIGTTQQTIVLGVKMLIFFYRKWGSFAVPVFHGNKCVGVLEFIMDAPRDYTMYISLVQALLEHVGLQTSIPIDSKKRTYIKPEKRSRKTYTSSITWYGCLAPLFGLSSARAAEILATLIKRKIPPSTFTNICRNAGIPEWPCIRNTTVRASSVPEIQINETISEASSSIRAPFPGLISTSDYGYPEHSLPNSMADFGGMKDQDNGKSVNVDHPDTDMISNGDYVFPEHSPPNSMADFAGMKDQDNNARVMHLDSMDDEKSVNTYCPNADMISNGDYGFPENSPPNPMADLGGMKDQDNNSLVMCLDSMDNEKSVNTYRPNAGTINLNLASTLDMYVLISCHTLMEWNIKVIMIQS